MSGGFLPDVAITVDGKELDAAAYDCLVEVRAESSIQLPDQVQLRFLDPAFTLYDSGPFAIGARIKVALSNDGPPRPVVDCYVTAIGVDSGADTLMSLVVTALGADHRLYRGTKLANYVDMSDSAIAAKVAADAGLKSSVDASDVTHAYVMQAGPDNRFLDDIAHRLGYRWWVDGDTLHFKKSVPSAVSHRFLWGTDELLSLKVTCSSADATSSAEVRAWNPDTQEATVGRATSSPGLTLLGTTATGPTHAAASARQLAKVGRFQATRPVADVTAANKMAEGLCARAAADEVVLRGSARGTPTLRAGTNLRLDGLGGKLSGEYRVATVEHVYTAKAGYITRFTSGGQTPTGVVDLLGGHPTSLPWDSAQLVIGVVTNLEDPERPSGVKVTFPTLSDTFESAWARVVMPGAGNDDGKGRGLQLLPEVGDEVLVGFEHGDPQRPIVLGGLCSTKLPPPLTNDKIVQGGRVATRVWQSRGGHFIALHDSESETPDSIVLQVAGGNTVLTIGTEGITLVSDRAIDIACEGALSLSSAGDVTIEGNNIALAATQDVTIEGVSVSVAGHKSVEIGGPRVDIAADAQLSLDGGATAELKGGMVTVN